MVDVVVTVPQRLWSEWLDEGCLPNGDGTDSDSEYMAFHFWLQRPLPDIKPNERVYIVAHGRLRGYAPLVRQEQMCKLNPRVGCLLRSGGAVACTIDQEIQGFQGVRTRWWRYDDERAYPEWQTDNVPGARAVSSLQGALL